MWFFLCFSHSKYLIWGFQSHVDEQSVYIRWWVFFFFSSFWVWGARVNLSDVIALVAEPILIGGASFRVGRRHGMLVIANGSFNLLPPIDPFPHNAAFMILGCQKVLFGIFYYHRPSFEPVTLSAWSVSVCVFFIPLLQTSANRFLEHSAHISHLILCPRRHVRWRAIREAPIKIRQFRLRSFERAWSGPDH